MKQNAIKSIFEYFLSDHTVYSKLAQKCYEILQTVISKKQQIEFQLFSML